MSESYYDIDGIIREAILSRIDITPSDRQDWKMMCCALKVLGYDEHTFVALSSNHQTPEKDSRNAWRAERNPSRYATTESAVKKIVALAKESGMDVKKFLLSQREKDTTAHRRPMVKPTAAPTPQPPHPVSYIPNETITAAHRRANETSLYKFLCSEFEPAEVDRVFELYQVGASKYLNPQGGRAAVFPYIDTSGRCVDCKIFHIDPSTGSRKTAPPVYVRKNGEPSYFTWALTMMGKKDSRAPWCNFGDHLLQSRPNAPVGIVESEKTALIVSIVYPGVVWLAVGSMNNLDPSRLAACRGRDVTIYPDRDGFEAWREKAAKLAKEGITVSIDTTTLRHYPEFVNDADGKPQRCKKDLADLVLEYRHGTIAPPTPPIPPEPSESVVEVWENMKQRNPQLAEIEKVFQLDISTAKIYPT